MALGALSASGSVLLDPLYALWFKLVQILPGLVLALLVLILGYCVAYLIGHLVRVILDKAGVNKAIKKSTLTKVIGHTNVPALTGELVKWFVFIIFLQVAVEILQLGYLNNLLDSFVRWLPNVLFAVIVLFLGVFLAYYLQLKIKEHTKVKGMYFFAALIKWVTIFLATLIALKQLGVQVDILQNSFLILLGSLGLGLAIALGIGLGLGLRKTAQNFVDSIEKSFR